MKPSPANMGKPKRLALFNESPEIGFLSIFYAPMDSPLSIWEKQVRGGSIVRMNDQDGYSHLQITGSDVLSSYIMAPCVPFATLGIKLPHLVLIAKRAERIFAFEVQVKDDLNLYRRLRFCNYHIRVRRHISFSYVPLLLEEGWNQITINLKEMIWKLYETNYVECVRIKVYPNCSLRQIYFAAEPLDIDRVLNIMRVTMNNTKSDPQECPDRVLAVSPVGNPLPLDDLEEFDAGYNEPEPVLPKLEANVKEVKPSPKWNMSPRESKLSSKVSRISPKESKVSPKESQLNPKGSEVSPKEFKVSRKKSKSSDKGSVEMTKETNASQNEFKQNQEFSKATSDIRFELFQALQSSVNKSTESLNVIKNKFPNF